jgi:predicted MFS family arabinose efflux permease
LFALRPLPFATDAVSFAASALLLRNLPPLPSPPREKSSLRRDIGEGLRFLFARPVLRAMVIAVVLSNLLMGAVFGVFVLYSLNVLHLHPAEYGLLFTAFAAGAVVGSLFAGRLRSLLGAGPAVITSMLLLGLPFLLMVLLPDAYVAGAAMLLIGIGEGVWNVLNMSLRQAVTPDALRGRVLSTFRMFGLGSGSVGAALGGVLAAGFGVSFPILVAGIALPAASVLLLPALSTRAIEEARVS